MLNQLTKKKDFRWFAQECEMVKDRWLFTYIPKLTFGKFRSGYRCNTMTIKEGIRHLRDVVQHIKDHPELYE